MDQIATQAVGGISNLLSTKKSSEYYTAPDGTQMKVRKASARMQELFPMLKKDIDPTFFKHALRITYTTESLLTIFSAIIIIELFVKNPTFLIAVHSIRILGVIIILGLTAYNLFRGYQSPEVSIRFYFAELLIVLGLVTAAMIIQAVRIHKNKQENKPTTAGDIVTIVVPTLLIIFNIIILGQQIYRVKLGKTRTPISSLFTLALCFVLMIVSSANIASNRKKLKET
jgi:hypothetical protein